MQYGLIESKKKEQVNQIIKTIPIPEAGLLALNVILNNDTTNKNTESNDKNNESNTENNKNKHQKCNTKK